MSDLYTDDESAMIQEIRRLRAVLRAVESERNELQVRLDAALEELAYSKRLLNG